MEKAQEEKQLLRSHPPLVHQPYPWLVICHGKREQRQTFFSISEDCYYTRIIPLMRNKYVCSFSHGWLLLEDYSSEECFLLNLVSMEKVQLPPLKFLKYDICILSSPPSSPGCRAIFINGWGGYLISCRPGDDEFVRQELILEDLVLLDATIFEGKIYGLTAPRYALVIADFTDPGRFRELLREGLPRQSLREATCSDNFLIDSCGEILFVHKTYLGLGRKVVLDFQVFRADFSKMVWVKMESIGERAIFLGLRQGMSCAAIEFGIRRNSIYYFEPHD